MARWSRCTEERNPYLQVLLRSQDFSEKLASFHTERVAKESHLLDIFMCPEVLDMGFEVCSCVKLETLSLNGEHLFRDRHFSRVFVVN